METVTREKTQSTASPPDSSYRRKQISAYWRGAAQWLSTHLDPKQTAGPSRQQLVLACASIFLLALSVRLLHWQDNNLEMTLTDGLSQNMARQYRREARRMLDEGRLLFPRQTIDNGNARMIIHPPGYSMLMAATFKLVGESDWPLRFIQIICDGAAAIMLFLIAVEFFPSVVALIAALLAAFSPHFAYYAPRLSPDSLAVLPILIAVYLVFKAIGRPRWFTLAAAGASLGLSCWLRSNGLLLALFLAVVTAPLFERDRRLRCSAVLVGAMILVISPITIRNWVVYHHFIPLSLGTGINLVQGIAELDKEGRFRMPLFDREVLQKDVEWNNEPEYGGNLWTPDGFEREQTRLARGLEIIRANPGWFFRAIPRRAAFILSYNESRNRDWPFNTATVPVLLAAPPFAHTLSRTDQLQPVWSSSSVELVTGGATLSPKAKVSLAADEKAMRLEGDGSGFGDQFASSPIPVQKNNDYLLTFSARIEQGLAAAKVVSPDHRTLFSTVIREADAKPAKKRKRSASVTPEIDLSVDHSSAVIKLPFASGGATEVRLVLSNNQVTSVPPVVEVGRIELFAIGATHTVWTHYPRVLIRGFQRNVFKTVRLLPIIAIGAASLLVAGRTRTLLILLAVPAYYLLTHSAFSTEYRYILAIHYFLFILAAVTVYCVGRLIAQGAHHGVDAFNRRWDKSTL